MKQFKGIIVTVSFLLVIFQANAQPSESTWLTTSVGINSTWIMNQNAYGTPEMDYSTKFGLSGMIGLNYYINTKYGLSTGIGIGNYGQRYGGEQAGAKASRKVNLNYIQVPLLAMKQLCDPHHPCWLTFGPQIMILTSATQQYTRDAEISLENQDILEIRDAQKLYKPLDIMLNLGFSNLYYMRTYDNMRLMVSYNTALGLFDINEKDYRITRKGSDYKGSHNFYIGVQVGLMFNP